MSAGNARSEDGEMLNYIDLKGPLLPGTINDILCDVIKPTLPEPQTISLATIKVHNSHVFNVEKPCLENCSPGYTGVKEDSGETITLSKTQI